MGVCQRMVYNPVPAEGTDNRDVTINDIELILCPELIASAHKRRVLDLFLVWSVARAVDARHGGRGILSVLSLRRIMFHVLPIKSHYTYQKLQQGVGKFWNRPGGKAAEQRVGMWSLARILDNGVIAPEIPPCHPFKVTVGQLRELSDASGQEGLRAYLLGMVRARHGGARPLSNAIYGDQVGDSRSTARRHLKASYAVTTIQNWLRVSVGRNILHAEHLRGLLNEGHGGGVKPYSVVRGESGSDCYVVRRLPNSYAMPDADRATFGSRPKEVRAFDTKNSSGLRDQCYVRSDMDPKKSISKRSNLDAKTQFTVGGYGFVVGGTSALITRGKVCLWECPRFEKNEDESAVEYLARMSAYKSDLYLENSRE